MIIMKHHNNRESSNTLNIRNCGFCTKSKVCIFEESLAQNSKVSVLKSVTTHIQTVVSYYEKSKN